MRKVNFTFQLQPSLFVEARKVAKAEGVAPSQLTNVALVEKLSALRTESCLTERAARVNIPETLHVLDRADVEHGDELPDALTKRR
jgi:hypothetical protein